MKYLLFFLFTVSLSTQLYAESYSPVSIVKGVTIGSNFARVQLAVMGGGEGCDMPKFYRLDTSTNKEMFSAILAAKATGERVSFQLVGCQSNMPNITHVYLCDELFCN